MNKKIIIPIIVIIIILVVCFIIYNNRTISSITLDINPSIRIDIGKDERVKKIIPLNDDANGIIDNNVVGKNLDDVLGTIAHNVINKGYGKDDRISIILYSKGNIDNEIIKNKIIHEFGERRYNAEIITIDNITKEDEELAKKYNISSSKAAYLNEVMEVNNNIEIDDVLNKSINELEETKMTGNYCDKDYNLEGSFCIKEIRRENALIGNVCPVNSYEYKGKCYEEDPSEETDKLLCHDDFKLEDNNCIRIHEIKRTPSKYECTKGEAKTRSEMGLTSKDAGDANDIVCVDLSKATHPVSPCELPASDPTERMKSGGKCYWHRAPVIPGGCPGKIKVNGECWDDASNILICAGYRDGKQYQSRDEYCEHSIKYIDPEVTEYICENGYEMVDNKCIRKEQQDPYHERICPSGYNLVNNDRCINYNKTINKVEGYYCENDEARLKDDKCIYYEAIEAKS